MAERLQNKCEEISYQCDDPVYEELAARAVTIAYMKAMVLYNNPVRRGTPRLYATQLLSGYY